MGSKIRKIASIEKGLEDVLKALSEKEIQDAIGKTKDYIAKCSDPDPADKIIRNIDHYQSVALDKACIKKGISPPMLTAHQYMIDEEKYKNQTNLGDVDKLLVKFFDLLMKRFLFFLPLIWKNKILRTLFYILITFFSQL